MALFICQLGTSADVPAQVPMAGLAKGPRRRFPCRHAEQTSFAYQDFCPDISRGWDIDCHTRDLCLVLIPHIVCKGVFTGHWLRKQRARSGIIERQCIESDAVMVPASSRCGVDWVGSGLGKGHYLPHRRKPGNLISDEVTPLGLFQ